MTLFNQLDNESGRVMLQQGDRWLLFQRPAAIYVTYDLAEVVPLLREVEAKAKRDQLTAVGMLSYESSAAFDPALQTHTANHFPLAWFSLYRQPMSLSWADIASNIPVPQVDWQPNVPPETYTQKISQIHDHIAKGETYQVNYSYRQQAKYPHSAEALFQTLNHGNNGRYGAWLDTGRFAVCSASPELFFTFDPTTRTLDSKPMKGTIHRGKTRAEDLENGHWLQNSEKNRAENLMIVDMIRNDMSRVAELGSVRVPDLFKLEKYSTLWTMTSKVECRVQADKTITDIFEALFPCASITGAPKVSTMQIIRQLESTPRGIYCGTIGMIEPNGRATFNVAIRTAVLDKEQKKATYGVGGGIVWDSDADTEWIETQTKSKILQGVSLSADVPSPVPFS